MRSIGCRVVFLHLTKLEYQSSIDRHRESTLRALDRYAPGVVTRASDTFIKTAIVRGCTTREDYQVFFEQVADPVGALSESFPVAELDDAEIDRVAEEGAGDERLKVEIGRIWRAAGRTRIKNELLLRHDAGVMTVTDRLNREGQRVWVLTLDRTMQELSLQRAGPYGLPSWIALDTLVEVLAVDDAGPEIQAEAFVPILISMLDFEVEPSPATYTINDLMWLLDIEERCATLEDEKVKAIAATVARERLAGRPRSDPELHLAIQRAFQAELAEVQVAAAEGRRQVHELSQALAAEKASSESLREAYVRLRVSQLRRDALVRLAATVAFYPSLAALVIYAMYKVGLWATRFGTYASFAVLLFGFLLPGRGLLWQILEAVPRYRQRIASAEARARQETLPTDAQQ